MYYQKPCLFNTTLLDWVTKCNTSLPHVQLPQIHIFQGLCEENPSSIWGLICCNRRRISADLFLKQAPKAPKSLPFCKGRSLGWIWPISVKWWKSVWILVCARVSFHFPFYFFGLQTKQCWDMRCNIKTESVRTLFLTPLV